MEVEEPVRGGYSPASHFHAALPGMLSPTLIGHQVVQMCQPREKCLLAAAWMMESFHREQFPLDGVVGWSSRVLVTGIWGFLRGPQTQSVVRKNFILTALDDAAPIETIGRDDTL